MEASHCRLSDTMQVLNTLMKHDGNDLATKQNEMANATCSNRIYFKIIIAVNFVYLLWV